MAASQNSCASGIPCEKPPATRRVWTRPEEEVLIHALKELVANGWKVDNGFRPGYLLQLETAIALKFPHAKLSGAKHINSKLTVWKKTYGQVSGICGTSGFGFNSDINMVKVPSDSVWDDYVRVHPDVAGFRNKSFPYYDDWIIIFGRDRATGQEAQQIDDAILELEHPHKVYDEVVDKHTMHGAKGKPTNNATINLEGDDDSDDVSGIGTSTKGKAKEGTAGQKRKHGEVMNLPKDFVKVFETFFKSASQSFEGLACRIAPTQQQSSGASTVHGAPNKTKEVFELVGKITDLPAELRVRLTHKIVSSPQNVEMLLNMDEECQVAFVHLLLQGVLE